MESPRLKALEAQIAELSPEEVRRLADDLALRTLLDAAKTKTVDWERFDGVVKGGPDGLEFQRTIRAEWIELCPRYKHRNSQASWRT